VRESAEAWLAGAQSGDILNRSGDRYKPSVMRGYEQALRLRVLPAIGAKRLSQVTTADLQLLVDRWRLDGLSPSTVRNMLLPLRGIYRRAVNRDGLPINPTRGIELPAVRGGRDRIVNPGDAARMIVALPVGDRALWATAFYAGLRAGELLALRWCDLDVKAGVIRVERSWDKREGPIEPKSRAGKRSVPIAPQLRAHLAAHQLALQINPDGLVFGRTATLPFAHATALRRAARVWEAANLPTLGLHDARHTYASLMIAAGVNAKALSTFMGHSSVTITFDRYGHLMPGSEAEAATLLDAYPSGATDLKAGALTLSN
jgi:integrase